MPDRHPRPGREERHRGPAVAADEGGGDESDGGKAQVQGPHQRVLRGRVQRQADVPPQGQGVGPHGDERLQQARGVDGPFVPLLLRHRAPRGLARVLHRGQPLRGGDAEYNAKALLDVLKGKPSAFRDVAILNAATALIVAGKAKDLKQGAALATKSIETGEAEGRLDRLIAVSNAVET